MKKNGRGRYVPVRKKKLSDGNGEDLLIDRGRVTDDCRAAYTLNHNRVSHVNVKQKETMAARPWRLTS